MGPARAGLCLFRKKSIKRDGQGFRRCLHMRYRLVTLQCLLCEYGCLDSDFLFWIIVFQGKQQGVIRVAVEYAIVFRGGDRAMPAYETVIYAIQVLPGGGYLRFRLVIKLCPEYLTHGIAYLHQAAHAHGPGRGKGGRIKPGAIAYDNLAVYLYIVPLSCNSPSIISGWRM